MANPPPRPALPPPSPAPSPRARARAAPALRPPPAPPRPADSGGPAGPGAAPQGPPDLGSAPGGALARRAVPPARLDPTDGPAEFTRLAQGATPAALYLSSLRSAVGRGVMRGNLDRVAAFLSKGAHDAQSFPWHDMRYPEARALLTILHERKLKPATIRTYTAALRGVWRECKRLKLISAEDYSELQALPPVKGKSALGGRDLTPGEVMRLLAVCDDGTPVGARDRAMLALGALVGLRRAEISAVRMEGWKPPDVLVVPGKGGKEREVTVAEKTAAEALDAWLRIRGREPGPLFLRQRTGGRFVGRLAVQSVGGIIAKRIAEAGIAHASTHDLRRTFATRSLEAGMDSLTLQSAMGHESLETTKRYDRRGLAAQREGAKRLTSLYAGATGRPGEKTIIPVRPWTMQEAQAHVRKGLLAGISDERWEAVKDSFAIRDPSNPITLRDLFRHATSLPDGETALRELAAAIERGEMRVERVDLPATPDPEIAALPVFSAGPEHRQLCALAATWLERAGWGWAVGAALRYGDRMADVAARNRKLVVECGNSDPMKPLEAKALGLELALLPYPTRLGLPWPIAVLFR